MVNYSLINKEYAKGKKSHRFLKVFGGVLVVLMILIGLFMILMGGLTLSGLLATIGAPLLYYYYAQGNLSTKEFRSLALEVALEPGKLSLFYPSIDDKEGVHSKKIEIQSEYIENIRYNRELKAIQILAKAQMWVEYKENINNNFYRDDRNELEAEDYIICLPYETKEKMVEEFEEYLNTQIRVVES